jgi:hypothetical protein
MEDAITAPPTLIEAIKLLFGSCYLRYIHG